MLTLLVGGQLRMWRNGAQESLRHSPLRSLTVLACIAGVGYGVFCVFLEVFGRLNLQETYGGHAIHFLLLLLFTTLTVMLFFSNAIILYGSLTRSREMDFLIASPTPPAAIFGFKYLESMAFASWALLLLAAPMVAAFAVAVGLPIWFLPVFLVFLLTFVPIPAAGGAVAALLVGRFAPRNPGRVLAVVLTLLGVALTAWIVQVVRGQQSTSLFNPWATLDRLFERLSLLDTPVLPAYWLTQGLESASNYRFGEALFYWMVTAVNAMFLNTWAVLLGTRLMLPMVAAVTGRASKPRLAGRTLNRVVFMAFFFLPRPWRLLIGKDLRLFFRDPAQWSQCLIFLLLLAMYMYNVPKLGDHIPSLQTPSSPGPVERQPDHGPASHGERRTATRWLASDDLPSASTGLTRGQFILAALNTVAAGLITAVFTSRFVFPMPSLEGRRLWAMGVVPIPLGRGALIMAKFFYSLLLCGGVSTALVVYGSVRLQLPSEAIAVTGLMAMCTCAGLSALAVGSGARWPDFQEENAAKIAGGFGGTVNLMISLGFLAGLWFPPVLILGERIVAGYTNPGSTTPTAALLPTVGWVFLYTMSVSLLALRWGYAMLSLLGAAVRQGEHSSSPDARAAARVQSKIVVFFCRSKRARTSWKRLRSAEV